MNDEQIITKTTKLRMECISSVSEAIQLARADERIQILKFLNEIVLGDESKKNIAWCHGVKAAIMLIKGSNKRLRKEATYEGWLNNNR